MMLEYVSTAQRGASLVWLAGLLGSAMSAALPPLKGGLTYGKLLAEQSATDPSTIVGLFETFLKRLPTVPKSWFSAFYAIGLAVDVAVLHVCVRDGLYSSPLLLAPLVALAVHLARRLAECALVHRWGRGARMPLHLWLAGVAHYLCLPFSLLPICVAQRSLNALANAAAVAADPSAATKLVDAAKRVAAINPGVPAFIAVVDPRVLAAVSLALVVAGNVAQNSVHRLLASMRGTEATAVCVEAAAAARTAADGVASGSSSAVREPPSSAGKSGVRRRGGKGPATSAAESTSGSPAAADASAAPETPSDATASVGASGSGYLLPSGGIFEHLVCPHYTAEVVLYVGLVLLHYACVALAGVPALPVCSETAAAASEEPKPSALFAFVSDAGSEMVGFGPLLLLAWVTANLAATASHTKAWYLRTFPAKEDAIKRRAPLLPWLNK